MKSKIRKFKIGSFIFSIQYGIPKNDEKIRQEAVDFMSKATAENEDCIFTGMELHYKSAPNRKIAISRGTMIIRM